MQQGDMSRSGGALVGVGPQTRQAEDAAKRSMLEYEKTRADLQYMRSNPNVGVQQSVNVPQPMQFASLIEMQVNLDIALRHLANELELLEDAVCGPVPGERADPCSEMPLGIKGMTVGAEYSLERARAAMLRLRAYLVG